MIRPRFDAHFDAVVTGDPGGETSLVWIAPVGTPVPEQVFSSGTLAAAGWRAVGTLHGVLYVADQAELDRAIEAKTAQAGLEAADAEHAAAAPYMKPTEPEPRSAGLTIYDDALPENWDRDQP